MLESAAWKTNREQLLSFTETTSVPLWGKSSRLTKGVGKCEFIWSSLGAGVVFTPHLPGVQMSAREALEQRGPSRVPAPVLNSVPCCGCDVVTHSPCSFTSIEAGRLDWVGVHPFSLHMSFGFVQFFGDNTTSLSTEGHLPSTHHFISM